MQQNQEDRLADPTHPPALRTIRTEAELLAAQLKQTGLACHAFGPTPGTTQSHPNAPAMAPGANLPERTPPSPEMDGLFLGLSHQAEGSKELAEIDGEIVAACGRLALVKKESAQHEAGLVELDALLSARAGIWQEQIDFAAIIAPMLAKHGFPLQGTAVPVGEQGL